MFCLWHIAAGIWHSYSYKERRFPWKACLAVLQSQMRASENQSIALVDDEKNIRELIGYALRKEGYKVITYVDGEEAWGVFQKNLPDLVILDILMPRMDWLELFRKIRSVSEQTPLIFMRSGWRCSGSF